MLPVKRRMRREEIRKNRPDASGVDWQKLRANGVLDSLGIALLLVQVEESLNAASGTQTVLVQRLFSEDLGHETVGTLADRCLVLTGNPL